MSPRREFPTPRESNTIQKAPAWAIAARELMKKLEALEAELSRPGPSRSFERAQQAHRAALEAQRYEVMFLAWADNPPDSETRGCIGREWVAFQERVLPLLKR